MKGEQVTPRYLERHGFHYPIAVTEMEGLGLKLPPTSFSVKDVEEYVGKTHVWCRVMRRVLEVSGLQNTLAKVLGESCGRGKEYLVTSDWMNN